jgi:hypothetical protein
MEALQTNIAATDSGLGESNFGANKNTFTIPDTPPAPMDKSTPKTFVFPPAPKDFRSKFKKPPPPLPSSQPQNQNNFNKSFPNMNPNNQQKQMTNPLEINRSIQTMNTNNQKELQQHMRADNELNSSSLPNVNNQPQQQQQQQQQIFNGAVSSSSPVLNNQPQQQQQQQQQIFNGAVSSSSPVLNNQPQQQQQQQQQIFNGAVSSSSPVLNNQPQQQQQQQQMVQGVISSSSSPVLNNQPQQQQQQQIVNSFPYLVQAYNGHPQIYLDNLATNTYLNNPQQPQLSNGHNFFSQMPSLNNHLQFQKMNYILQQPQQQSFNNALPSSSVIMNSEKSILRKSKSHRYDKENKEPQVKLNSSILIMGEN